MGNCDACGCVIDEQATCATTAVKELSIAEEARASDGPVGMILLPVIPAQQGHGGGDNPDLTEASSEAVSIDASSSRDMSEIPSTTTHRNSLVAISRGIRSTVLSAGAISMQSIFEDNVSFDTKEQTINVDSVDQTTAQLVSFQGSRLLRASRLSFVMRCGAAIYANSEGSASTYRLSQEVKAIDTFISHNWSVARWKKFFCLALHFNLRLAVLLSAVALVACSAGTLRRVLPLIVLDKGKFETGLCATLLVPPLFLLVSCFGQELRRPGGCCDPTVFLDKTCIHQTDTALQSEGILKLGAFINHSSKMVIIYTDIYLKKLWTVYEVACFVSLHPSSDLAVASPAMAFFAFGFIAVEYFIRLFYFLAIKLSGTAPLNIVDPVWSIPSSALSIILFELLLRHLARTREAIRLQLTDFRVEECICSVEADRPVVYRNIALLMRAKGDEVDSFATDEITREAFNKLVSKLLHGPLTAAVRFNYQLVVSIILCTQMGPVVDAVFGIQPWSSSRELLCSTAKWSTWTSGFMPLNVFLLSRWCGVCLHLSRRSELIFLLCGCLMGLICLNINLVILDRIWYVCVDYEFEGLITILIFPFSALLASAVWHCERRAPK